MTEFIRFAVLGLAAGAVYALLAQGMVLVYKGSGLLNFAQGAMAMVGAYVYYEATVIHGLPRLVSLAIAVAVCGAAGALVQLLVLHPMRHSSALSRVISTLGLLIIAQSAAILRYGSNPLQVPSIFSTRVINLGSRSVPIGIDRLAIIGIGIGVTLGLTALFRWSSYGRVTQAVAEDSMVAASLGHSPQFVASVNWALGSGLAGLAGVLIAPIIYLEPTSLVLLVIPAMTAALIGEFRVVPLTLLMSLLLGIANSELTRYVDQPGWATAAPFLVILAVLVIRGRGIPLRGLVLDRMPSVSPARVRPVPVVICVVVAVAVTSGLHANWAAALTTTLAFAIICLSIVVVTGLAGQLSLAQAVLAGVGALIAAQLSPHVPFVVALIAAVALTALIGLVTGVPALRVRGASLAIATLGLGGALSSVVLGNGDYTGGVAGLTVHAPALLGLSLDPFLHPNRYAVLVLLVLVAASLLVLNIRSSSVGRRLLSVRSNERAATALGVNVAAMKSYAFLVGAGLAALGGVLLAFQEPVVAVGGVSSPFTVFNCILLVAATVAGGVGWVGGAFVGSTMLSGGILSLLLGGWDSVDVYLPLIGGISLILMLIFNPDGVFVVTKDAVAKLLGHIVPAPIQRLADLGVRQDQPATQRASATITPVTVLSRHLSVRGLTVTFGGVHALQDVDLDIVAGEVHGLIGPNGAGKTTLVDAITGFVSAGGSVLLGDEDLRDLSGRRRATAGISRSFQSLELFNDLTVRENLAVASEAASLHGHLRDLFRPRKLELSATAEEAVKRFELASMLDRLPSEISFGQRKAVAIARAVATSPSILLLDEPAAGLDDREASELATLIRDLATDWGIGVLLIEHRVDMVLAISDRLTVLQAGRVIATGTPAVIREDPKVHAAYMGNVRTPA